MYMYVFMHLCKYCMYVCTYVMYVCTYVMYVCTYVSMFQRQAFDCFQGLEACMGNYNGALYACANSIRCMYVSTYVYVCVCLYIYVYIYIQTCIHTTYVHVTSFGVILDHRRRHGVVRRRRAPSSSSSTTRQVKT